MTTRELNKNVKQVVDQIVRLVTPVRIILFGSAAKGQTGPDSDLDFLIVVQENCHTLSVIDQLYMGVRKIPMPCDFLVVTDSMLRKHRLNRGLIYHEILARGKEVYAA